MRKTKPLTKAQYQENFAKIFSVVAQLMVAAFLVAVVIYSIFQKLHKHTMSNKAKFKIDQIIHFITIIFKVRKLYKNFLVLR